MGTHVGTDGDPNTLVKWILGLMTYGNPKGPLGTHEDTNTLDKRISGPRNYGGP